MLKKICSMIIDCSSNFIWIFYVCLHMHRFNHELVFGISVKNLSKAERLIYGDSLMTHAMILTAVTDQVSSHKYTMRDSSVNTCKFIQWIHKHTNKNNTGLCVWDCVCTMLKSAVVFLVLSISPLVSSPSSFSLQSRLLTLIFLLSSFFLCFRREKKAMRNGGWKTPGAMTVGTKVKITSLHFSYTLLLFSHFLWLFLIIVERSNWLKHLLQLISLETVLKLYILASATMSSSTFFSISHLCFTTVSLCKPSFFYLCLLN